MSALERRHVDGRGATSPTGSAWERKLGGGTHPEHEATQRAAAGVTRRTAALSLMALGGCAPTLAAAGAVCSSPLDARLEAAVAAGEVPGVLALTVEHGGQPNVSAFGLRDRERGLPMTRDTIFRIGSMTKPIVAATAMTLVEDGAVDLDEPVERWLPELADRKVVRSVDGPIEDTYPSPRSITLRDLLTSRAGYTHPGLMPAGPLAKALLASGTAAGATLNGALAPDAWIARLGAFPLTYPPGQVWQYQTPTEILGVLIRRVAGAPLEQVLAERMFQPLGMVDTGFSLPAEKLPRLAGCYSAGASGLTKFDDYEITEFRSAPAFPNAGGGLVSTADDYLRFATLLLNRGAFGGRRVLSRDSVRLMTTNHLTPAQRAAADAANARTSPQVPALFATNGFGFGVSVGVERGSGAAPIGAYGWDGLFGTEWINDPAGGRISILLMQVLWGAYRLAIGRDFKGLSLGCGATTA